MSYMYRKKYPFVIDTGLVKGSYMITTQDLFGFGARRDPMEAIVEEPKRFCIIVRKDDWTRNCPTIQV